MHPGAQHLEDDEDAKPGKLTTEPLADGEEPQAGEPRGMQGDDQRIMLRAPSSTRALREQARRCCAGTATSSPRRCRVTRPSTAPAERHAALASDGAARGEARPQRGQHGARGQALPASAARARTARSAPTCCRTPRSTARSWSSAPWSRRQRALQRGDHLGAAGMAGEAVDRSRARRRCAPRMPSTAGPTCSSAKGGMARSKMTPKPCGSTLPAHDVERVGPVVLAGALDARQAALAGAQHAGRRAVAEQRRRDDVGGLVAGRCGRRACRVSIATRSTVDPGRASREAGRDGEAGDAAGAAAGRTPARARRRRESPCGRPPAPRDWASRCRSRTG